MKEDTRTQWKRILVVLLSLAVIAGFVLFDPAFSQIDDVLKQMTPAWLLAAAGCVFLYYLGDTAMYLIACFAMGVPQRFFDGLITTMIGMFYSALTPLASGGQPFQVIQMRERGIHPGTATSVLMVKFLGWHVAITLFGLVGFTLFSQNLASIGAGMTVLFCIGFLVHAFCATLGVLLMIRPAFVHRMGMSVIGFLGKTFLKRKQDKLPNMQAAWENFIAEYARAVAFALAHKACMLCILLVAIVEVGAYQAVTYFVYRGLGFDAVPFVTMLLLQAMLSISVAFIPLPGASVASEGGFYALFSQFFGPARLAGMLIWRALTYYMTMLLGLVAVLVDGFRKKHRHGEDETHVSR